MPEQRGARRHVRRGEVYLRRFCAHSAYKVAVGRGDGDLAVRKYAHVPAQTRSARRRGYRRARFYKRFDIAEPQRLQVYFLSGGYHYATHAARDFFAFYNFVCRLYVGQPAVCARAYDRLVYLYLFLCNLVQRDRVFGQVRTCDRGLELA